MRKFIFVLAALLMSCAHQKTGSEKTVATVAKKTRLTASNARPSAASTRDKQDFNREKAMILAAKRNGRNRPAPVSAHPQNKRLELSLKPDSRVKISEAKLMSELQDRYDMNDELGFQSRYQALQKNFPKSARISEAHYMAGLMSISNKNYGPALKAFDQILKKSPRSAQAPKAMFAKAITYKRMNLPEPSRGLLRQVQAKYPKSLEAQRAVLELKIQERTTR